MTQEILSALDPRSGCRYVDGTFGGGGHTRAMLRASFPDGLVLALDRDLAALSRVDAWPDDERKRVTLAHSNFRDIATVARAHGFDPCDGIILDLGLSSDQLADESRGFSFQLDSPLDMRYDASHGRTAADLLNEQSVAELADIFYYFGEERRSRRLARAIVARRTTQPFARTGDLVDVTERVLGGRRGRTHPATRIFQALRIAVNEELTALDAALNGAADILRPDGRIVVLSFHSLEDRIVKRFIAAHDSRGGTPSLRAITRKPLRPSADEVAANPRARSARLRVAERLPADWAA